MEPGRADDRGRRALPAGVALVVSGVMPGFLTASLAPRMRDDFAFGDGELGLAIGLFYVVSAIASTPCGRLTERISPTRSVQLSAALTAASCAGVAALSGSAAAQMAMLVPGGVGNAMAGPAVSALLRRHVAHERQGLAFGAQQSGATLGALLAGLALPVVALPLGWRWAFLAATLLAAFAALATPGTPAPPRRRAPATRPPGLSSVHLMALTAALASAASVGLVSFLVVYAVDVGISEAAAGLLLGGMSLTATASRIGLGAFADRHGQDALRLVATMLALSAAGYLMLLTGRHALVVAGALLAGGVGWAWPGALTLAVVRRAPGSAGWAVGVMMAGLFVGAIVGPLVVGLLAERAAYDVAWLACAALALAASVTVTLSRRGDHRRSRPT